MENNIKIFENDVFGSLRTINENGKIMFVASDVAKMLGYKNVSDAISKHCRYIAKCDIPHPQGKGTLEVNIIPEGDVYRLIAHSKLPSAEKFESWVFDEVLPSIRKNGGYIAGQEILSDEELMAKALMVAQRTIENKNKQIAEMKPKVDFYNDVTGSIDTIDIAGVAKVLNVPNMGRNKLFAFLREKKILNNRNEPYQCFVDKGYFRQVESKWEHEGTIHINLKTVVFQKGLDFIRKLVLEHKN